MASAKVVNRYYRLQAMVSGAGNKHEKRVALQQLNRLLFLNPTLAKLPKNRVHVVKKCEDSEVLDAAKHLVGEANFAALCEWCMKYAFGLGILEIAMRAAITSMGETARKRQETYDLRMKELGIKSPDELWEIYAKSRGWPPESWRTDPRIDEERKRFFKKVAKFRAADDLEAIMKMLQVEPEDTEGTSDPNDPMWKRCPKAHGPADCAWPGFPGLRNPPWDDSWYDAQLSMWRKGEEILQVLVQGRLHFDLPPAIPKELWDLAVEMNASLPKPELLEYSNE